MLPYSKQWFYKHNCDTDRGAWAVTLKSATKDQMEGFGDTFRTGVRMPTSPLFTRVLGRVCKYVRTPFERAYSQMFILSCEMRVCAGGITA